MAQQATYAGLALLVPLRDAVAIAQPLQRPAQAWTCLEVAPRVGVGRLVVQVVLRREKRQVGKAGVLGTGFKCSILLQVNQGAGL